MANSLNSNPLILDSDVTSWRAAQTLATKQVGVRITKIVLQSAGSTLAGTVSIVDPNDNTQLYPLIAVAANAGANGTILLNDNIVQGIPVRDLKIVGVSATVTRLLIFYR